VKVRRATTTNNRSATDNLHTNGRHDAVDCHIHGVLCMPIAVLSVVGGITTLFVVAAVTTLLMIKLISVTFCTSFTVDYLRLRCRRCLSRDAQYTAVISFLFIAIHYYFDDVFNTNANRPNAVEGCRDIALNTEQTGRVSEDAVWRTYGPTH